MDKPRINRANEQLKAAEFIRKQQQGLGRPIISEKFKDQQIVAVGNRIYFSDKWKTFIDFLSDYIKSIFGSDWGNRELKKPKNKRHILLRWYEEYCKQLHLFYSKPGQVNVSPMSGAVFCYIGTAYNLYLLKHNVELQDLLVKRLKDENGFQGAYYELLVANCLIRAGLELVLEDETDRSSKHCEFAAVSKQTGEKYWVEAKMRAVQGWFGKTDKNSTNDPDPTSKLIPHLIKALKKPAANKRLIFIDLNGEPQTERPPKWAERAATKLEDYERRLSNEQSAYVFVTNTPFHRTLNTEITAQPYMVFGLGISDFVKSGNFSLSEIYRRRQKHIDAMDIFESLRKYPQLPQTFNGKLPSRLNDNSYDQIIIGETYYFEGCGPDGKGEVMTVTTATVNEDEETAYIGTSTGHVLKFPMTDEQLLDFKEHPEAYWGKIQKNANKKCETIYDLFESMVESYLDTPKSKILGFMKESRDYDSLSQLSQKELVLEYCERCCWSIENSILKEKDV